MHIKLLKKKTTQISKKVTQQKYNLASQKIQPS